MLFRTSNVERHALNMQIELDRAEIKKERERRKRARNSDG